MGLIKSYLVLYNALLAACWTYVLYLAVSNFKACGPEDSADADFVPAWLKIAPLHGLACRADKSDALYTSLVRYQTLAIFEIVHVALGLVGGKISSTFWQVYSRVMIIWGVIGINVAVITMPEFTLMAICWSVTEVIRYNWYWMKEAFGQAPFFLTWCRYSFFLVLYPLGVYSELNINFAVVKSMAALDSLPSTQAGYVYTAATAGYRYFLMFLIFLYLPVFPFLFMHMLSQRKKRLSRPRPNRVETEGILFPPTGDGERSTSVTNQVAFVRSVIDVDPATASKAMKEKNWRFGYQKHVIENVALSCRSPETCLKIAKDGLDYLYDTFQFGRDSKFMTLREAMQTITTTPFKTVTIKGEGQRKPEFTIGYRKKPYPFSKESDVVELSGQELKDQLNKWVQAGSIEPSSAKNILEVVNNKQYQDLSDKHFVVLGATSEMGPFYQLLDLGATVIAIDINIPRVWEKIISYARKSAGTVIIPVRETPKEGTDEELAKIAGCNLLTETPEILNWIVDQAPDKELTVGGYAYLDGERHVRIALAMDAIMSGLLERRKKAVHLAFLCSPTDVFVVDNETRDAAIKNYKTTPLPLRIVGSVLRPFIKKAMSKNAVPQARSEDGEVFSINDGVVVAQGPNYALAKRLQHWRAMLARSQGRVVSTNIAPSTATLSVVHNKSFAAAYGGFGFFPAMEIAYRETSNSVMAALMLHDILNPNSFAHPNVQLRNPQELFKDGAFHGGIWRCGFKIGSIGEAAATMFLLSKYGVPLAAGTVALAGLAASMVLSSMF